MKNTLKKLHWKEVMIGAISILLTGFGIALWATHHQNPTLAFTGIIIMGTVCISWWFWVMVVIKTMIDYNERTLTSMTDLCTTLSEIKQLVKDEINGNR
jgi:hypothetical protein